MTKLSILQVSFHFFLLLFMCLFTSITFTHENVYDILKKPPAAKVAYHKPPVKFVENPDNQPGITDNFTVSILGTDNNTMESEKEHMQEHMRVELDVDSMTERELQFYYFKMFDTDNNQKLDGTELIKSKLHIYKHEEGHKHAKTDAKIFTDNELAEAVDPILHANDINADGFIDYYEFKLAQPDENDSKEK